MNDEIFVTDGALGYLEYAGHAMSTVVYTSVACCRRLEVRETRDGFEVHAVGFTRALDSQEWHERTRRKKQTYQSKVAALEEVKAYERGYWGAVAEDLEDKLERAQIERQQEQHSYWREQDMGRVMTQQKQTISEELRSTIRAEHIERAEKAFFVRFTRLPFVNEYLHPQEKKLIRVMAQTEQGALRIAEYHYGRLGKDFAVELRQARELPGAYPLQQVSFLDHNLEISL